MSKFYLLNKTEITDLEARPGEIVGARVDDGRDPVPGDTGQLVRHRECDDVDIIGDNDVGAARPSIRLSANPG
jgi:hypothetical protein